VLDWVVIGIGVNVAHAPALPDRPTACLAGSGATPAALAMRLMAALDHWGAQSLDAVRAAWLARAHPPGTALRVQQSGHVLQGVFDGLAPDGGLVLRGQPALVSGEVFLEAPDAAGG
jgi:BirA family biotin operon repressor/biotin-[acetyl-CoA-carboxylase] ligase